MMESLKQIKGMPQLVQSLPKEYRSFSLFTILLRLEYEKDFDYENWTDIYHVKLLVSDVDERYKILILLKNVHGTVSFMAGGPLSGFAISDMREYGFERSQRFYVYDYENRDLCIHCEDIEVALQKAQ